MIIYLQKLAAYDAWANQELLCSLVTIPHWPQRTPEPRLLEILAHLAAAKMIWLDRIAGLPMAGPVWPHMDATAAQITLRQADERLLHLAAGLTIADLTRPVVYRDSAGNAHTDTLSDVVIHAVNHGTYHRGQLAAMIARQGGRAAYTDYIMWIRQNAKAAG